MRSDAVRWGLTLSLTALAASSLVGCDEKPPQPPTSRFAGVTRAAATTAPAKFCDTSWQAGDPAAPKYKEAPTQPLEGQDPPPRKDGWRWVNAWATWCTPCVEEMGLLARWRDALRRDGAAVSFELLSIDTPDAEPELRKWRKRNLPGDIRWLRSEEDFGPWLDGLGVDRAAAIPIHVLVDPTGQLRCVRVGAVHEQDFGPIRALISAK